MIGAISFAAAYIVLLVISLSRRTRRTRAEGWLIAYLAYSMPIMVLYGLTLSGILNGADWAPVTTLAANSAFIISIGLVFGLTLTYLNTGAKGLAVSLSLIGIWLVGALVIDLVPIAPLPEINAWLVNTVHISPTLGTEISVIGWLLTTLILFFLIWRRFLLEQLPLYANRILIWAIVAPFLIFGDALSAAGLTEPWIYIGFGIRLLGAAGAVYAITARRAVDLRGLGRWIIGNAILLIVTSLVAISGTLAVLFLQIPGMEDNERWLLAIGQGVVLAIIFLPLTRFLHWALRNLLQRNLTAPTEAIRRYAQQVNGMIELDQLAQAATSTINAMLTTRKSALLLASRQEDRVQIVYTGSNSATALVGELSMDSVLYERLVQEGHPLQQYDIDYHKDFYFVPDSERQYFSSLEMDIYAPIVSDGELIGLLAVGPKINDDPFQNSEIELLEALASQTVVALHNARLVTDLRNLNEEITELVDDLSKTNERLEMMDSVKSDFITIASHELRTPLTQILGYSDLLNELAERRMLNPDEIVDITGSLSLASKRMTEVIAAMMDVSQLDVENMDLKFVDTQIANVIKLATENYAEVIKDRKQVLVARGLANLPSIKADYKRLVQAFENLVTNAIKFTPDGGKINIIGQVYDKDKEGRPVSIRITIEDTGIGVDKEHQEMIFEKFFRVGPVALHSTGATKFKGAGPGLGLSIARGIIEGHGGRIWIESDGYSEETFPGSKFHVVLLLIPPAYLEDQDQKEAVADTSLPNSVAM
nr:GAF domain-containing protein [Anaerolineae bacterium]